MNILLIEDIESWTNRMKRILPEYNILTAKNSTEAFRLIANHDINLILLDIILKNSELDGDEILERISKTKPSIPVAIMSCLNQTSIIEKCYRHGAKWNLPKDLSKNEIKSGIKSILEFSNNIDKESPEHLKYKLNGGIAI